jgi:hypothetical protein
MEARKQTGTASTSSVAVTETVTGTIALFGGVIDDGDTDRLVIVGAVVSRGTVTLRDAELRFPAPSVQISVTV